MPDWTDLPQIHLVKVLMKDFREVISNANGSLDKAIEDIIKDAADEYVELCQQSTKRFDPFTLALINKFRIEVEDKLSVVFNDANSPATIRQIHLRQSAEFLVDLFCAALLVVRRRISDSIRSQREDDTDQPRVQVFDVLADQVFKGK